MNENNVEEINKIPYDTASDYNVISSPENSLVPEGTGTIKNTIQDKPNPEDLAAVFFKGQKPKLQALLSKMSAKQLRRVLYNAVAYPLVEKFNLPRTQDERDALYLVHEMVLNKTVMQLHFEMTKAEDAVKMGTQEEHSLVKESTVEAVANKLEKKGEL